jgi:glycosyltransferase involved in cell wall biosynthesis
LKFGIDKVWSKASITSLRVGIATSGRFHILDLARELDALGVEVRFYSYVPRKRAETFGLPGRCHVGLLPFVFPLVALERLLPRLLPRFTQRLMCWALDMLTIFRMRHCEVFICMSGLYVRAARYAQWRYGARVILHRGSTHILSQRDILARLPRAQQITSFIVGRELQGYAIADRIAIPSTQVAESFASCPEHACKLFLSPYGVDLDEFPLRTGTLPARRTLLFVGQWSYRKGVDVLGEAVEAMDGVHLTHVGALVDAPFPKHPRFVHYEPVPQWELKKFYGAAHVFVLASREEGLALVQCQALASGLPLVCTDRTGGSDLACLGLSRLIRVVPAGDADALRRALAEALDDAIGKTGVPSITETERQALGWRRYALQHLQLMNDMLQPLRSTESPRSCHAPGVASGGDAAMQQ